MSVQHCCEAAAYGESLSSLAQHMNKNATLPLILIGIICFIIGGSVGYAVRSHAKLTPEAFEHQLAHLTGPETVELSRILNQALMKPRDVKTGLQVAE